MGTKNKIVGVLVGGLVWASGMSYSTASANEILNPPSEEWLTTVGPWCYEAPTDPEPKCLTRLITRTNIYVPRDHSLFLNATLDGPTGPRDLILKHDAWSNQAPAGDYAGLVFYSEVRLPDETAIPPGEYTYSISIDYPQQWTCSKFYSDVCRRVGGVSREYTYRFSFDGQTALLTTPEWATGASNVRIVKYLGDRLPRIRYSTNVTAEMPVLLQRRAKDGSFKTVARGETPSGASTFRAAYIYDKKVPRRGQYAYRVVIPTLAGDTVSNPVRIRVK